MRYLSVLLCLMLAAAMLCLPCAARAGERIGHWVVEAEDSAAVGGIGTDTIDIVTSAGLSLWWDEPVQMPCVIAYRACVVVGGGVCDRLSDLNCFWMASEPPAGTSPLTHAARRGGRFAESYRLQCYYVGYGGNHNTTTRFRRYVGDTLAVADAACRPPVLVEYTDRGRLLRPNHWYDIRLTVEPEGTGARVRYCIDGSTIVDYFDPQPLGRGWFALRTTWSHLRITAFNITTART